MTGGRGLVVSNVSQRSEVKVLGVSSLSSFKCNVHLFVCYFLLQDVGVGKTSLVGRFVHDTFSQNITTTLGSVNNRINDVYMHAHNNATATF